MRVFIFVGFFVLFLIFGSSLILAWGASVSYWDGNPLFVRQGESKEVELILQNMVGGEDIRVIAEIIEGGEIAELVDGGPEYKLPFGRKDVPVKLLVSGPEYANEGDEFSVSVSFGKISDNVGGNAGITTRVITSFPVIIGEEPGLSPERDSFFERNKGGIVVLIVLIAASIVYFGMKRRSLR